MSLFETVYRAILEARVALQKADITDPIVVIDLDPDMFLAFSRSIPVQMMPSGRLDDEQIELNGAIVRRKRESVDPRKITKGPWRHYETADGEQIVQRGRSGGFVVEDTDPDRAKADAALIAASPRLLFALEVAEHYVAAEEWLKKIVADALALAKGES